MFQTRIKGMGGREVGYTCKPFRFDESLAIQLELGRIMGGAAGGVIDYAAELFTLGQDGAPRWRPDADKAQSSHLGAAVKAIPEGIMSAGGPAFVRRILANVYRDADILGNGTMTPTKLCEAIPGDEEGREYLDEAYGGGNISEMYLAILWVLMVNFSPFGRTPSWSWKTLWTELGKLMPQLFALRMATAEPSTAGESASE